MTKVEKDKESSGQKCTNLMEQEHNKIKIASDKQKFLLKLKSCSQKFTSRLSNESFVIE